MSEYDYEVDANLKGRFTLPDEFQGEQVTVRQNGSTTIHRKESLQWMASGQNDHLEINEEEGYFEAEAQVFGGEKKLIKVNLPEGYFDQGDEDEEV